MVDGSRIPDFPVTTDAYEPTSITTGAPEAGKDLPFTPWERHVETASLNGVQPQARTAEDMRGVKAPPQTVKIGMLLPFSGPQAELGMSMLNAAQMAVSEFSANMNVVLLPEDTGGEPQRAAAAMDSVLNQGAQIVLGPLFAQNVRAVTPQAQSRGVPVLAFTTDWQTASRNVSVMGFLPFTQVARVLDYAMRERGMARFAVVAPDGAYSRTVASAAVRFAQSAGLQMPQVLLYAPGQATAAVSQLDVTAIDAVMLPVGGDGLDEAVAALDTKGIVPQTLLLGTGLWDEARTLYNPRLRGGIFAAPAPQLRAEFENRYQQNFGVPAPRLATLAYDGTALAVVLARHYGQAGQGPLRYTAAMLGNPSGFAGLDGVFRFRNDGLIERGLAVLELTASGPEVASPAPARFAVSGAY